MGNRLFFLFVALFYSLELLAVAPVLESAPDQKISKGSTYTYQPLLTRGEDVNWTLIFSQDDVEIDPATGRVTWSIPSDFRGESYYIGVKATNKDGEATDTWVLTIGNGNVIYIGPNEPDGFNNIKDGLSAAKSGDTVIMRNGYYTSENKDNTIPGNSNKLQIIPGGSAENYTTLMAEDPLGVTIDGENSAKNIFFVGSNYNHPDWNFYGYSSSSNYSAIKGFVVKNTTEPAVRIHFANNVKLQYIAASDSGRLDDSQQYSSDTHDVPQIYVWRSSNILIENIYSYGHSRYKVQFKESQNSVVRRSVARIDVYKGHQPLGIYQAYCSKNITMQNNIAIDGDGQEFWYDFENFAAAFGIAATGCSSYPSGIHYEKNLSLNVNIPAMDQQATDATDNALWTNHVAWKHDLDRFNHGTGAHGHFMHGAGPSLVTNATLGRASASPGYDGAPNAAGGRGFFYSRSEPSTVSNSIIHQLGWNGTTTENQGDLAWGSDPMTLLDNVLYGFEGTKDGSTSSYEVFSNNDESINSLESGLVYLPRVEAGSTLAQMGVGADISTFTGKLGVFYGEEGWDEDTESAAWPIKEEKWIGDLMRDWSFTGERRNGGSVGTLNGDRGFAEEGQTLTNYIWGYLGNVVPPFNVTALPMNTGAIIRWDPPAEISRESITGYKVYRLDGSDAQLVNTIGDVDTLNLDVKGLTNGQEYQFYVTSMSGAAESGFSYIVNVTPSESEPAIVSKPKAPSGFSATVQ